MRVRHSWVIPALSMVVHTSCSDAAASPTQIDLDAALLIGGVSNPIVSQGAAMANERVEELHLKGELSDLALARGIVEKYLEIGSPYENPINGSQALANMDWIINRLTMASANALTACARTELLRQAQHMRGLISRAINPGAVAPSQRDITPHTQGSWPWGGCPLPAPVQNLSVSIASGRATISWNYSAVIEEFEVKEVRSNGLVPVFYRLDPNDCGDATSNNCAAGQRLVSFPTAASNITVQVEVCAGLNCMPTRASARIPDPLTDLSFVAGSGPSSGITVSWVPVDGAEWYELSRAGLPRTVQVSGTSYTDMTARSAGTTYVYSVKACNNKGCSSAYTESFRR